jgi:hypothetical protein
METIVTQLLHECRIKHGYGTDADGTDRFVRLQQPQVENRLTQKEIRKDRHFGWQ